ncbi:pentatricopeptide repeat domain-containing protein 3, mitochondrial [Thalassophryne amazonica]|uniref:pentatricopeptide repeat domain-containing protein 3, mitochondrial n=1 Tax=Thalassophryne amazonica TaxID=390379 RepID=UPI001471035D|nr:pentatricopeptide repeat domain-containing protein 3, mitochondrial [Thalassophryne amazonica]
MAASSRHLGYYLHRNSRFLLNHVERLLRRRTFCSTSTLRQQITEAEKESAEPIIIPKKKTWSKESVLEVLAATVNRDPTAYPYQYQDDPYLTPKNISECENFSFAQDSGRFAAKYIINNNPNLFNKDIAEPHIPCLMPDTLSLCIEEVSEEALKERIKLRRVRNAVDMYDQLLQAGTVLSMETIHELLDLICLYCDKDPIQEGDPEMEDLEESEEEGQKRNEKGNRASKNKTFSWRENNNAERIFNLLPERDVRCYSALIRGMVKHGAHKKAFSLYTDMMNNRLTADVHTFNALISAAPHIKENYMDKRDLIIELLKQMSQQKVKPNLLTFNSILSSLRRCGLSAKTEALAQHTVNEMKALGIVPSLATYHYILFIFCKRGLPLCTNTEVLQEVLSELEGRNLSCQDLDDVRFFSEAMKLCLHNKDLELAYKIQELVNVGENWKLLGPRKLSASFYGQFFSLLCMMENIDVVLKWFRQHVPSVYFPTSQTLYELMEALDADSRLDLLPAMWADIQTYGHHNKSDVVEQLLRLMARDKHTPEVRDSFAACALDVKRLFDGSDRKIQLKWTNSSLTNLTTVLLKANKTQQTWEILQLFKANNIVPPEQLMEDFLSVCQHSGSAAAAVDAVQLSAAWCLPITSKLAQQTLAAFELNEDQRAVVTELESAGELME